MIHATITGNLGRDAELRHAGDSQVCSFSVASSTKIKGEEQTTWVRCSLWGRRGAALSPYLVKGTSVTVVGSLATREYEGRTYLELRAADVALQGGGKRDQRDYGDQRDQGGSDGVPF